MATNFTSDSLIVKVKETASLSAITSLQAQIGVTKVTRAPRLGIEIWQIPSGKVEETISAYINNPSIQYMERDSIITVPDVKKTSSTQENLATITPQTTTPNDPSYPLLWGLNNTGQTGGKPDADIDAPEAWDIQTGNPNLPIGVIDSGVDYTHPDLVGNIWTNPGEIAGDGIDNDSNGYTDDVHGWDFAYGDNDPMDVDGHGTHVAGTIAGKGNNGVGVTGVAWNAKIVILRFLDDSGSGSTSNAILAIEYATAKGVKLTNNSWGGGGYSQALYDAINTAGKQGGLFIAAAGNSSLNNDIIPAYPASYNLPNIISVASTTDTDGVSFFSNYGRTSVDLGAPGSEIYSTTPGGNYDTYSGTSMASPHVTGAAALVWSQNPTWTAAQVKNRLLQTTDPLSALRRKTVSGGRLNIKNALGGSTLKDNFNMGSINLNIAPTPPGSGGAGNLTETANAADSIKDLADPSAGNTANNTLNGEASEDPLTGGTGADTLMLPFAESSVSPKDPLTDFGSEKIDLVSQGRAAMNAPSLFSPANSTVPTLEKGVIPVFSEANRALAGNQALEINSDPLRVAKAGWMADIYPGIYDAKQRGI
jgi:subtilisin family serine protease